MGYAQSREPREPSSTKDNDADLAPDASPSSDILSSKSEKFADIPATSMIQVPSATVGKSTLHPDYSTPQKPRSSYRTIKSIPYELRERLIIYFEEALCMLYFVMLIAVVLTHS